MWRAFANGAHVDLIFESLCNPFSGDSIKFQIRKSKERGEEYSFIGWFNLGCGEYQYVLSLYSKGPTWHVYSLSGFSLTEYEHCEGFKFLKLLIGLLPNDLVKLTGSSVDLHQLLDMLSCAERYPFEFIFTD